MADLRLTLAITAYDRVLPLIMGEVKPDGITLEYAGMPGGIPRVFYEQIKFQRYDISEMSLSSFLRMRPTGWAYRMLPVFHNRCFVYASIHYRRASGIRSDHPEDLAGKRFGIRDYQQSAGLWTRGILQEEFGIKPQDMVWYQERGEHFSHTGAAAEVGLEPPGDVKLHYAGSDFNAMYLRGDLDASIGSNVHGSGIDRKSTNLAPNPEVVPLFSDPVGEAVRFYRKTGIYPFHHTTAVRESILNEHPWAAISLQEAFEESGRIALQRLRQLPPSLMVFGEHYIRQVDQVFGPNTYPCGIKANLPAFLMAQAFSMEQGLTARKQPLDEIFPRELIYREERG